jgi:predicted DNA binding CopG/RHH family protein
MHMGKEKRVPVRVRLPESIVRAIKREARKRGWTKTLVIEEALRGAVRLRPAA